MKRQEELKLETQPGTWSTTSKEDGKGIELENAAWDLESEKQNKGIENAMWNLGLHSVWSLGPPEGAPIYWFDGFCLTRSLDS